MNIGYAIAAALVDGAVLGPQFTSAKLDDDAIWRLVDRTDVHLDETFETPAGPGRYTTDLAFTRTDGTRLTRRVRTPPGGLDRPLNNDEVRSKYRALTDGVVTPARRDRIEALVLGLDEDTPVSELAEALRGEVSSPLG